MRTMWLIISTLALANLLTLIGGGAWLVASGRMDRDRVDAVREIFVITVEQQTSDEQEVERELEALADAAEEARLSKKAPLTAEQQLALSSSITKVADHRYERMVREAGDLRVSIEADRDELERQQAAFEQQVRDFDERRALILEQEGNEQFLLTVELYRSLKPKAAKAMMSSLIRLNETDMVVSYINALPKRTASKIISEFEKEDPALAADLLERLRQRGTEFEFAGVTNGQE